jgi:hypothetical protein
MGKLILIEGAPGTGKSASIRGLNPDETVVLAPNTKDLPFPGSAKMYNPEKHNLFRVKSFHDVYEYLDKINKGQKVKNVVVDDFSHLFTKKVLVDTPIKGYDKWNDLAIAAVQAMFGIEDQLRSDLYVFFMVHTVVNVDSDGKKDIVMQTPGRLLDNLVKIPSFFTYILHTEIVETPDGYSYKFLTNRNKEGKEAKSPEGVFDLYIDNDLGIVRDRIEKYINGEMPIK